jgi:uridine kinase
MITRQDILRRITDSTKRPYLVGIDGCSGAGKTSLAHWLSDQLDEATVIHKDDFYSVLDERTMASFDAEQGYYRYFDLDRLESQVFVPLANRERSKYQVYSWTKGELRGTKVVEPGGVIFIEGCYATRPELRHYYDFCIWVETSAQERSRRQRARGENASEWRARLTQVSGEFVRLVGIAGVVSAPLSYLFADGWLDGFAYRIPLTLTPFIGSILITAVIAAATVTVHTFRAASINPTDAIRQE